MGWENREDLRRLRCMLLVTCWTAALFFLCIPTAFSVAYAMTFNDEIAHKWLHGWLMDTFIGLVVTDGVSVLVAVLLGWLYSKYHRQQRQKRLKKKTAHTFTSRKLKVTD